MFELELEPPPLNLRNILNHLIQQCKRIQSLKQIHTQILTHPNLRKPDRYFLITRLLFTSSMIESIPLTYSTSIFHSVEPPNLFVYTAMIRSLSCNQTYKSIPLYKHLLLQGLRPDHLTFPFLVKECAQRVDAVLGTSVHGHIVRFGLDKDLFVQNCMVNMYGLFGDLGCARRVFDETHDRSLVSWNSLLIGYLRTGVLDSALQLFRMMEERNVITWNSIITGFSQGGWAKEALDLFYEMQVCGEEDRVKPDKITIASVVSACASLGALDQGKWVHSYLKRNGLECDMVITTALVDMYGKCGCLEKAVEVFRELNHKDVLAWTAMISVFALHGLGQEAFHLFEEMKVQGIKPNHVTFVGLLSACAHSGLVDKGRWCFDVMKRVYSIKPQVQHYACMVDLFGRAGLFEEAEKLIRSMPMEPDVYVWGALLGSCRMHGNVDLGEKVAQYLIDLEPLNHAFYVILSDIYAKANRFDDLKRIRTSMEERGIKKPVPGCSMIEVDGVVHEFSVRRSPQDKLKEIVSILSLINGEIKIVEPHGNHQLIGTVT